MEFFLFSFSIDRILQEEEIEKTAKYNEHKTWLNREKNQTCLSSSSKVSSSSLLSSKTAKLSSLEGYEHKVEKGREAKRMTLAKRRNLKTKEPNWESWFGWLLLFLLHSLLRSKKRWRIEGMKKMTNRWRGKRMEKSKENQPAAIEAKGREEAKEGSHTQSQLAQMSKKIQNPFLFLRFPHFCLLAFFLIVDFVF